MSEIIEPIAIVGMAGRFPGARDVTEFWRNVHDGVECVQFPDDERLRAVGVPDKALRDPDYVRAVALAPDIDQFDAEFFGFSPRDADLCDPQIRLFLESAHAAIENAGYDPARVDDVGVFGSAGVNRYVELNIGNQRDTVRSASGMSVGVLNNSDYVGTTVSYRFNFRGPSLTLQTACSSSLLATHLAAQSLRAGECRIALAGGADVEFPVGHGHWWAPGSPLTRDGHCRPFDASATGTIFGSGVGVVVLKLLSDALADGDTIRAVIRGTAVNNDGSNKVGFSAPSMRGQSDVVVEAMAIAQVQPADVGFVEAHATGTILGDPIEVAALNDAFRRLGGTEPGHCALASVKGNVGHLGHAAGVTSLIKTVLALENEVIPPSVNFTEPNPKLELDGSPFRVNDVSREWPRTPGKPRLAGINSLGIGGTNVHAIVEEAPPPRRATADGRPRVVVWSAKSAPAEEAYRQVLADHLTLMDEGTFADATATLQDGRTAHNVRAAVVATSATEAAAALTTSVLSGQGSPAARVAFLLPGQGSQHARMATGLTDPTFTTALEECFDLFDAEGLDLRAVWKSGDDVTDTGVAQPLLFAVGWALSRMWDAWGVRPDALLGHSIGELTAAAIADVFDLPDAVRLVVARARAMSALPSVGGMLAVTADLATVRKLAGPDVVIAAENGPRQIVVAGTGQALKRFAVILTDEQVRFRRLDVANAFHTPHMADAVAEFARAFDGVVARAPRIPVYSAATGALMSATDPAFWTRQLVEPVWFSRALRSLLADGTWTFLEVGPGHALSGLARQHPEVDLAVPTLPEPGDDEVNALTAAARLWASGRDIDWPAVERRTHTRRVPLPGYRYQRTRHWVDAPAPAPPVVVDVSPFSVTTWTEATRIPSEVDKARALVLLPADDTRAADLVAAFQCAGMAVLPVRPGAFAEADGGFHARPEDLERVFATLAQPPDVVVHALTMGSWADASARTVDEQSDLAFHSLLTLVQQTARHPSSGRTPGLLVVTERSVDVSGSEPVDPVKALLHGIVRTLPQEDPSTTAKLIDVGPRTDEDELAAELESWQRNEVVALRGTRRWTRVEQPLTVTASPGRPIRRQGVYLITGGLGGLGLAVAKGLARTGLRPRLVLLGRSAQDTHPGLRELTALGAEYEVVACDVADRRSLTRAIDVATARHGHVNGVLHLAGVAGDGLLQVRDRAAAEDVLRPKVRGTLNLVEVFAARPPLDFFVAFSSRAALNGLVGSGDYASANAFMDTLCEQLDLPGCRMLSLAWPSWSKVGMAAPTEPRNTLADRPDKAGTASTRDTSAGTGAIPAPAHHWDILLTAEDCPVLDEHRLGRDPVLPGTGHLDFVVDAFRRTVPTSTEGPLQLTDVVFQRPLVARTPRELRIGFSPADGGWRFTVTSTTSDEPPTTHVTGHITTTVDEPTHVDLDALRARLSKQDAPAKPSGRLFALGPRWNNVREIRGERTEKLVHLALPAAFAAEANQHALHPTLLDSATSYVRDPSHDGFHLPFMYQSMVVHNRLPAELVSHIRRRPGPDGLITGDIDLLAPDGQLLVQIKGFTMRAVEDGGFLEAEQTPTTTSSKPVGIDPEAGADLLVQLLTARTPRVVAVRPFENDRPIALTDPAPMAAPVRLTSPTPGPAPIQTLPAPRNQSGGSVEDRVRRLWTDALGIVDIGDQQDFFDLGGNSLTAVELISQIRAEFSADIGLAALFDFPTVGALAAELRRLRAG